MRSSKGSPSRPARQGLTLLVSKQALVVRVKDGKDKEALKISRTTGEITFVDPSKEKGKGKLSYDIMRQDGFG